MNTLIPKRAIASSFLELNAVACIHTFIQFFKEGNVYFYSARVH